MHSCIVFWVFTSCSVVGLFRPFEVRFKWTAKLASTWTKFSQPEGGEGSAFDTSVRTNTFRGVNIRVTQWRTEGGGFNPPPPPKFRRPSKIMSNPSRFWKLLKIAKFRTSTPQDVQKKSSKILKLPSVRNCFTLAITNKLVVIINSLKVPKLRKFYYMKWNFLYQITAASRTPD